MSPKAVRLLSVALALLLAACSFSKNVRRRSAMEEAVASGESGRAEDALGSFVDVDDRPPHMTLNDQIKRVVVKKTVVKPVYLPSGGPRFLTDGEIRHMLDNLPTERDIEDGAEYDDYGLGVIVDNYRGILEASASCCPFGIADNMGEAGLSRERIAEALADDARGGRIQSMCMIVPESSVSDSFWSSSLTRAANDARRSCICNNAAYLKESLANFYAIYRIDKSFYRKSLVFKFRDSAGGIVRHDMLDAVINITETLRKCP